MSYRESNIIVSCVSYLFVLGYYLVNWLRMYQEEGLNSSEIFLLWVIVIIATIVLNIVGNILTSIVLSIVHAIKTQSNEEPRLIEDERQTDRAERREGILHNVFSRSFSCHAHLCFPSASPGDVQCHYLLLPYSGNHWGCFAALFVSTRGSIWINARFETTSGNCVFTTTK